MKTTSHDVLDPDWSKTYADPGELQADTGITYHMDGWYRTETDWALIIKGLDGRLRMDAWINRVHNPMSAMRKLLRLPLMAVDRIG